MFKKFISILLCVIIPIGGMLMLTSCKSQNENITLSFVTTPLSQNGDVTQCPYEIKLNDSSFDASPLDFNKELAKTALILSSTAYSYTYALDNLEAMGFEHLSKFNYGDNYERDAVGAIIASRKFSDSTVMCIILRGTYMKEWYSNFDIGHNIHSTKVHEGFNKACEFTLEKLKMYMVNYGIDRDHCKFFVTGHSRGAAVANLVSKKLIDAYGTNNVYSYTFATPNTTTSEEASDTRYSGIFNFVNPEDFICTIPLKEWGFTKYGTTISFPENNESSAYNEKIERVSAYYEKLKGRPLKTYSGTKQLDSFLEAAIKLSPTVSDYYNTKYEIAGLELSLYEYMNIVSHVLNEDNLISNGLILLNSDGTAFEPLKNYIMFGMDMQEVSFSLDYEGSMISYAHAAETYLAWLEVYLQDI